MTRTKTLERGVEEWSCAECGRRLLLRRPPSFQKIVLDPGDEWAAHVGGAGSAQAAGRAVPGRPGGGELSAADRGWLASRGIEWGEDQP
jgi:hypothetical protein